MKEVGTINMRTPQGRKSYIAVSLLDPGNVDIVVSRSSEGEALIRIPLSVAKELSELLALAVDPRFSPTDVSAVGASDG